MIGFATMVENRQAFLAQQIAVQHSEESLSASRSMKALTLVGIIFIPLAFTSSLFSMTEHFAPGSKYFWVYLAVAIPLVLLVVFGYAILDWGFNSKVELSLGVMLRSVREKRGDWLVTDASKHY
jgi:Mg2+ and Co2+ transporter CorA